MAQKPNSDRSTSGAATSIVIRRTKKAGHDAHHGGAWKIAYADFVTAMMAFFLLMWLLGSTSKFDREGIQDYFNTPLSSMLGGKSGAGSAAASVVQGGGHDLSSTRAGSGGTPMRQVAAPAVISAEAAEMNRLSQLKQRLSALIEQKPELKAFKEQIRMSITNEGLRIEVVDSLKRPMFATGSAKLEDYASAILLQIAGTLNEVDNRLSIAGHTDTAPYSEGPAGYSNWELSSERANAARRALVAGHLDEKRLLQVRGLADVLPLERGDADAPINRRISILVMNKAAERAFFSEAVTQVSASGAGKVGNANASPSAGGDKPVVVAVRAP
jgi:chemotaxis protein MotB